jgi:two-component system, chemotaxis family, protein-glutamate methylesterase/glutaminase
MANRDVVAIATSAGGVEGLAHSGERSSSEFSSFDLVTVHAGFANEGESIKMGRIYIAPSGRQLIIDGERLSPWREPRSHGGRCDAAFRCGLLRQPGDRRGAHRDSR